ncbi:MAG TPA: winged helix-turn-helix domain-containing protein [Streptosporangiaceae bacterium]|nr:winged helix-turn-helix domain-containing protein [Streptosporangiaceae bacterium]
MPADTSDPRALRALAHPVRWKLMDLLAAEGTATVTRCADALGESTATCSYHLGILGKYGYIARAPDGPGRDKPWRLAGPSLDLSAHGLDPSDEPAVASRIAAAAYLDHAVARIKESLSPAAPAPGSKIMGATTWLTAEELRHAAAEVEAIMNRYSGRETDPAQRPEGARQARMLAAIAFTPDPPPEPGQRPARRSGNS